MVQGKPLTLLCKIGCADAYSLPNGERWRSGSAVHQTPAENALRRRRGRTVSPRRQRRGGDIEQVRVHRDPRCNQA